MSFVLKLSWLLIFLSSCTIATGPGFPPPPDAGPGFPPPTTAGPNDISDGTERTSDFLYDLTPDTFIALTCPTQPKINAKSYFTLNLGAYDSKSGRGLQLGKGFKRNNGINKSTSDKEVLFLMQQSPFVNARATFSVQDETNLQQMVNRNGKILSTLFPLFNNPDTLANLSKNQPVFTSRSSSSTLVRGGGQFKAWLPITGLDLQGISNDLRRSNQGEFLLTLTYTLDFTNKHTPLINPRTKLPYGRGYKINFGNKTGYLTDMYEEDFTTDKESNEWICPEDLRILVHRARARRESPFDRTYGPIKGNSNIPNDLLEEGYCQESKADSNIRGFFNQVFGSDKPTEFVFGTTIIQESNGSYVDTKQACIVLSGRNRCYRNDGFYRIEFDSRQQEDCVLLSEVTSQSLLDRNYYKVCPAYLSACYRNN